RLGWLVEAEQQAVPGLARSIVGLVGEVTQGGGEPRRVLGSEPEVAQHQERLGSRASDLGGDRAARRLRGHGIVVRQTARGSAVVLLGPAAYRSGARGPDQVRADEDVQVVGDVALVAVQRRGELADRGLALAEGEQQPVTCRMAQRLELCWR